MLLQENSEYVEANTSGFSDNVQRLARSIGDASLKLRRQRQPEILSRDRAGSLSRRSARVRIVNAGGNGFTASRQRGFSAVCSVRVARPGTCYAFSPG